MRRVARVELAITVIGLTVAGLAAAPALADAVTLPADKDNTLYELASGDASNGAGDHFFAGETREGFIRRGMIRFDEAAAVPPGSTINSVTLTLNCSPASRGTMPPTSPCTG